jgi:anaerobic magnesium-protoporphyrin IX monomethyl ester cyclase
LISANFKDYGQLDSSQNVFSLYSVMGCPYQCTFCSSPAQYRLMEKKFILLPTEEVVDHIEYLNREFSASYIYFIDDDSFVDLKHVEQIIDEIKHRQIKVKLGFRGARIDEIKRMSDEFIAKLAESGTNIMHIGAESGSQKMLDLFKKNCTVQDIIEVNLKLAKHPQILAAYNWVVGVPAETTQDLKLSAKLMLRLIGDNPRALIFIPNTFRPLENTELYELAVSYGYQKPKTSDGWIAQEAESRPNAPWISSEAAQLIRMMQIASFFIDDKVFKVETGRNIRFFFIRIIAILYRPIARLRMRFGLSVFLIEDILFTFIVRRYQQ